MFISGKRAQKNRKPYVFLRQHRHEIFDEEFQRELIESPGAIVCKPRTVAQTPGLFAKHDFHIDLEQVQATCPAGQTVTIELGQTAQFPANRGNRVRYHGTRKNTFHLRISPPYSINVRKSTASIPDYPPAT